MGDGEFNQDATTREVLWSNGNTSRVISWSLKADRTLASSPKFAWDPDRLFGTTWKVVGIGNIAGTTNSNDNIVLQSGALTAVWSMQDGAVANQGTTSEGIQFVALTSADRIKALADVDGDNVLDLVGQNDGDGTIASYALTAGFTLKNTSAPRAQYFAANNPEGSYRPGKGGIGPAMELVNVAQYGA